MSWFLANLPYIGQLTTLHLAQSVIPAPKKQPLPPPQGSG